MMVVATDSRLQKLHILRWSVSRFHSFVRSFGSSISVGIIFNEDNNTNNWKQIDRLTYRRTDGRSRNKGKNVRNEMNKNASRGNREVHSHMVVVVAIVVVFVVVVVHVAAKQHAKVKTMMKTKWMRMELKTILFLFEKNNFKIIGKLSDHLAVDVVVVVCNVDFDEKKGFCFGPFFNGWIVSVKHSQLLKLVRSSKIFFGNPTLLDCLAEIKRYAFERMIIIPLNFLLKDSSNNRLLS